MIYQRTRDMTNIIFPKYFCTLFVRILFRLMNIMNTYESYRIFFLNNVQNKSELCFMKFYENRSLSPCQLCYFTKRVYKNYDSFFVGKRRIIVWFIR